MIEHFPPNTSMLNTCQPYRTVHMGQPIPKNVWHNQLKGYYFLKYLNMRDGLMLKQHYLQLITGTNLLLDYWQQLLIIHSTKTDRDRLYIKYTQKQAFCSSISRILGSSHWPSGVLEAKTDQSLGLWSNMLVYFWKFGYLYNMFKSSVSVRLI